MQHTLPHTQERDGPHPCIHHCKWRLSGLRSNHAWVKVYHSPWQAFTSTLHRDPHWSMSKTLLDCLQQGGAVSKGWQKYTEQRGDWRSGRQRNHSYGFLLSFQQLQDNCAVTSKLKQNNIQSKMSQGKISQRFVWSVLLFLLSSFLNEV